MSRHDVAVLVLRGFALYAWFQALEYIAGGILYLVLTTVFPLPSRLFGPKMWSIFAPVILFFAAGLFLFVRSRELALWLLPPQDIAEAERPPIDAVSASALAFAAVGAVIFLYALPRVLSSAIAYAQLPEARARAERFSNEAPQLIASAIQLVLGFVLFLKSRAFATAWRRKQGPASAA